MFASFPSEKEVKQVYRALTMTAEVFTAALLILMLAVLWCIIKNYRAVMAARNRTASVPVQCSEMEEQQRDLGAANWRERAGERNWQTVNLRPGGRARPREHDERCAE